MDDYNCQKEAEIAELKTSVQQLIRQVATLFDKIDKLIDRMPTWKIVSLLSAALGMAVGVLGTVIALLK